MLDIKDIKGLKIEELLVTYDGKNPYINYIKKKYETEKSYFLTNSQTKYITNYFNYEPRNINKVVETLRIALNLDDNKHPYYIMCDNALILLKTFTL